MRSESFSGVVGILVLTAPALAQNATWGITGSALLGSSSTNYQVAAAPGVGGWSIGLVAGPLVSESNVELSAELGYARLNSALFDYGNNPGFGSGSAIFDTHFESIGLSAQLHWAPLGAHARVSPYLIGGLGWQAVRTTWAYNSDPSTGQSLTVGTLSYDGGIGVRVSRFFVEARATAVTNAPTPSGERANLYAFPVTLGVWF